MSKQGKNARLLYRKALALIHQIEDKYPQGLPDLATLPESSKEWLYSNISSARQMLDEAHHSGFSFSRVLNKVKFAFRFRKTKTGQTELIVDFFRNLPQIKSELENKISNLTSKSQAKSHFERFASNEAFGNEMSRKEIVDSLEDFFVQDQKHGESLEKFSNTAPKNIYSNSINSVLDKIKTNSDTYSYITSHPGIAENVQTDILEWIEKCCSKLQDNDPFVEEAAFIRRLKNRSESDITQNIATIKKQYIKTRHDNQQIAVDFDFYERKINEAKGKKENAANALSALKRNLIADLEKDLLNRKNQWEIEQIEKERQKFLEELYKKIEQFRKIEQLVSPFIKDLGRLWDLSKTPFKTSGFELLARFAELLNKDESLQELAEMLGKQNRAQSTFEKELCEKVVTKNEYHPQPAYRGQIMGIRFSNDIPSVIPSELALLKNNATRKLFALKFAQKQLLSFKYETQVATEKESIEHEWKSVEKKEPKGPVIVCVDTSGSMSGQPESIAKTITFALSKIAIEEKRKCFLISFSTGISVLNLSDFKEDNALENLISFLKMSFNGGTDAEPALRHSLKLLAEKEWKNADVLMISDFVMGNISEELQKQIEAEKAKNTCFYSLVIGNSGNKNAIECFNHNWAYNLNDAQASSHLVEQLHTLRNRPTSNLSDEQI